ncbi:MAG: hypothetical protein EOP39_22660 [Rubrivivax sp.]|nr:MAG: hypothetical protein EOP39_22660 [Rubrivivax sp.]
MDTNANFAKHAGFDLMLMPADLRFGDLLWRGERWGWRPVLLAQEARGSDQVAVQLCLDSRTHSELLPEAEARFTLPAGQPVAARRLPKEPDPLSAARTGDGAIWVDSFVAECERLQRGQHDLERLADEAQMAYCRAETRFYAPQEAARLYLKHTEERWVRAVRDRTTRSFGGGRGAW